MRRIRKHGKTTEKKTDRILAGGRIPDGEIRVCDVEKYYGSDTNITKAVDRVSFCVQKGEFVGIMGASGSGKTTLLKVMYSLLKPLSNENRENLTKEMEEQLFVKKIQGIFRPDEMKIGRLVSRKQGSNRTNFSVDLEKKQKITVGFGNRQENHADVLIDQGEKTKKYDVIYIPTKEMISTVEHFVSLYDEYHIDFEDLERKLALSQTTLMIFCNPHNPIGKIWDKETLQKIGDLCAKHHVTVLSDEIHCDITNPQKEYIPFASVSKTNLENTIMCIAPTKAFNMAGMQTACIVVANEVLRHKVNRGINTDEVAEPNSFAICATKAAFNQSEDWLNELNQYIQKNKDYAISFIQKEMNDVYVVPTEATYLLWIDCHKVCMDSVELTSFIREKTGLYVSDGLEYGENGKAFIRMNVACPFERLKDGLNRFKEGIYLYQNK